MQTENAKKNAGIIGKFNALPTNTKILAGILGILVLAGGMWIFSAINNTDYMIQRRNDANIAAHMDKYRCEELVKKKYARTGDMNTTEFWNEMRQCR